MLRVSGSGPRWHRASSRGCGVLGTGGGDSHWSIGLGNSGWGAGAVLKGSCWAWESGEEFRERMSLGGQRVVGHLSCASWPHRLCGNTKAMARHAGRLTSVCACIPPVSRLPDDFQERLDAGDQLRVVLAAVLGLDFQERHVLATQSLAHPPPRPDTACKTAASNGRRRRLPIPAPSGRCGPGAPGSGGEWPLAPDQMLTTPRHRFNGPPCEPTLARRLALPRVHPHSSAVSPARTSESRAGRQRRLDMPPRLGFNPAPKGETPWSRSG